MTWREFWELFHRRWGSDRGDEPIYRGSYNKGEWGAMQAFLYDIERRAELFPVLYSSWNNRPQNGPLSVPFAWLAKHEGQVLRNHGGQTLKDLARRGGLSPVELWAVCHGKDWSGMAMPCTDEEALTWLRSEPWKDTRSDD